MKVYTTIEILNKLENCIEFRLPFSHIRYGDGGIKFLHAVIKNDFKQLGIISEKEGMPMQRSVEIMELWGYYSRMADFIDTPEVYFTDEFWGRLRTPKKAITQKTLKRMKMWNELYSCAEFDNEKYCNPESNYLMLLNRLGRRNLLDVMKGRRICIITAKPEVKSVLKDYDVDIVEIKGHYENQYKYSFESVVDIIENSAKEYDFWLVAAGELGRIYSGLIKENGGRTIDIGFIIEFWLGEEIHPRLEAFMIRSCDNALELKLREGGVQYERFI